MDALIDLAHFAWAAIGFVFGCGSMLFLCHHLPVTDEEKRELIRRWTDEFDAKARR